MIPRNSPFWFILLFIIIGVSINGVLIVLDYEASASYALQSVTELDKDYHTAISANQDVVEVIIDSLVRRPDILSMIRDASGANESELISIRSSLYQNLNFSYQSISTRNVKQMIIFLPDGRSLLRMKGSDKYGDSLLESRYLIRRSITGQVPVNGFEPGMTYTGFRYVYPLFINNSYVGGVQMSVSLNRLPNSILKNENSSYQFLLKKDYIEGIISRDQMNRYRPSDLSDDFLVIKDDPTLLNRPVLNQDLIHSINEDIRMDTAELVKGTDPFTVISRDGGRYYYVVFLPVFDSQGRFAAYLVEYREDFTLDERVADTKIDHLLATLLAALFCVFLYIYTKDAKEKKRAYQKIRESKRELESLISNIPGVVFRCRNDDRRTMEFISEGVMSLTGYPARTIMSDWDRSFGSIIHPEDRNQVFQGIIEAIGRKEPYQITYRIISASGEERFVREQGNAVPDASGSIDLLEGVMVDITDLKRTKMELNKAYQSLQKAHQKMHLLSSITRHDILNKFASIHLFNSLLQMGPNTPEETEEYILRQKQGIEDAEELITFTRVYEEIGILAPVWNDLFWIISPLTGESCGLRVQSDLKGLSVYADPMFVKVFRNLIDNSIRHGKKATRGIFGWKRDGDELVIIYTDDGIGIDEKEKSKIFEQGYGHHTGLGLFLTAEILSITGISIRETGVFGEGARFEIRVPAENWQFSPPDDTDPEKN